MAACSFDRIDCQPPDHISKALKVIYTWDALLRQHQTTHTSDQPSAPFLNAMYYGPISIRAVKKHHVKDIALQPWTSMSCVPDQLEEAEKPTLAYYPTPATSAKGRNSPMQDAFQIIQALLRLCSRMHCVSCISHLHGPVDICPGQAAGQGYL